MAAPRLRDGILARLLVPIGLILAVFATGIIGYLILGFSFVDSLSNTVLVMTTVGFSAPGELSASDKVFTDAIAVLGVTSYLALLAIGVSVLAEGQFGVVSRRRRMERQVARRRGHFIVCAYGRVGRAAAAELTRAGERVVVIDRLEGLETSMRADRVPYLIDDPTSEDVLRRARIMEARALISAVDSDADSVFITLTARTLRPDLFIVSRGGDPHAARRLYRAGANRVISPYVSSGRHMALLALRPRIVDYLEIRAEDGTSMRLEEVTVEPGSPFVASPLREACGAAVPLVLRRARGGMVTSPSPDELLEAEDLIVLLGDPGSLRHAEED